MTTSEEVPNQRLVRLVADQRSEGHHSSSVNFIVTAKYRFKSYAKFGVSPFRCCSNGFHLAEGCDGPQNRHAPLGDGSYDLRTFWFTITSSKLGLT